MPKKKATPKATDRKPNNPFEGRWRITWMEQWDQDYIDMEVEGYIEFKPNGLGAFQFGFVEAEINYRPAAVDEKPRVEFTFDGNDEMEPAQGRGWATIEGKELHGEIIFHGGDESAFKAKKR